MCQPHSNSFLCHSKGGYVVDLSTASSDDMYGLLKGLRYDHDTGELVIPEVGDILVFLSLSFRNMVRWTATKFGGGSTMIWYNIGKVSASAVIEAFRKMKESESPNELISRLDAYTTVIGWGRVHTAHVNLEEKRAVIRITNSALTRGIDWGHGCDFIRGYLSGLYDMIFETSTFCEEALCESKGANHCEFHIRKR